MVVASHKYTLTEMRFYKIGLYDVWTTILSGFYFKANKIRFKIEWKFYKFTKVFIS